MAHAYFAVKRLGPDRARLPEKERMAMNLVCPFCLSLVSESHVNRKTDVTACPTCHDVFAVSVAVAKGKGLDQFNINRPSPGTWFIKTETGWEIGTTQRTPLAFVLVPICFIFSGLGFSFLTSTIGSHDEVGNAWVFSVAFAGGGIPLMLFAVASVLGRMAVSNTDGDGRIFRGVGPIGWTRRFDWR